MKMISKIENSILGMLIGVVLSFILMHILFIFPLIGMASKYSKTNKHEKDTEE